VTRLQHRQRAPRFAIPIPILYRTPGDLAWLEGWTENISKSGVLFRAQHEIPPDTPVEMMLEIPTFIATPVAGAAICRGRIVRTVAASAREDRHSMAAAILEYELARPFDPRRI
jgi:PilZ domain-containing protein